MKRKGYYGRSAEHGLNARGVKTKYTKLEKEYHQAMEKANEIKLEMNMIEDDIHTSIKDDLSEVFSENSWLTNTQITAIERYQKSFGISMIFNVSNEFVKTNKLKAWFGRTGKDGNPKINAVDIPKTKEYHKFLRDLKQKFGDKTKITSVSFGGSEYGPQEYYFRISINIKQQLKEVN